MRPSLMRQVPFIFISLNDYPPSRGTLSVLYYPMPTLACEKFNLQTWSCSLEVHSIIALFILLSCSQKFSRKPILFIYHSEELKRVQKELEEKRLAVTYSGQQLSETQHKLRTMEGKANQLQAHNIQLSVKLEELKTKYEGRYRYILCNILLVLSFSVRYM